MKEIFENAKDKFEDTKENILAELKSSKESLKNLQTKIDILTGKVILTQ